MISKQPLPFFRPQAALPTSACGSENMEIALCSVWREGVKMNALDARRLSPNMNMLRKNSCGPSPHNFKIKLEGFFALHDSTPDVEDAKPRARRVGLPEKCPVPPNPTTNNQNRRLHAATWFPLQRGGVPLPPHSKANWRHQGSLEQLLLLDWKKRMVREALVKWWMCWSIVWGNCAAVLTLSLASQVTGNKSLVFGALISTSIEWVCSTAWFLRPFGLWHVSSKYCLY